jgi:hypothetical protein
MFEATLRYNSNSDKHPVATSGESLDSLLIPGKMLAANSKALPTNLRNWYDSYNLEYYIQPTLFDFRVGDNFRDSSGSVRTWHWDYATEVDRLLEELLAKQDNVDATDLSANQLRQLTISSVEFQESFVPNQLEAETGKYESISDPEKYSPKAVIPWFQQIRDGRDLKVNEDILDVATDVSELPLKPCLFLTKEALHSDSLPDQLTELFTSRDIDQCFLWIENLDKQETGEPDYERIASLVANLDGAGISPHFYYGDYFATLLSHLGLTGTTYGTMYGEEASERRERRKGDGVAHRYYVDAVKDFLKIPAAVDLQGTVGADMCSCEVCSRQFGTWADLADRYQDDDENIQALLKKHHIQVRWKQIQQVESESLSETLDRLDADYREYITPFSQSNQISNAKTLDYLPRWKNALESVSES